MEGTERVATFYPSYYEELTVHTYESAKEIVDEGVSVRTTQMCLLNKVKDYDLVRIHSAYDIINIFNNHDGTYSCDRTQRVLRRGNDFFKLWENGEFDEREDA